MSGLESMWIGQWMVILGLTIAAVSGLATAYQAAKAAQSVTLSPVDGTPAPGQTGQDNAVTKAEATTLLSYYRHALARSNISFGLSLLFAAIGFVIIVVAIFSSETLSDAAAKLVGGTIIEAVASLFIAQSRSSQKSMTEFFEKLRKDRMAAETRQLLLEIEDPAQRDALRSALILHYAGLPDGAAGRLGIAAAGTAGGL